MIVPDCPAADMNPTIAAVDDFKSTTNSTSTSTPQRRMASKTVNSSTPKRDNDGSSTAPFAPVSKCHLQANGATTISSSSNNTGGRPVGVAYHRAAREMGNHDNGKAVCLSGSCAEKNPPPSSAVAGLTDAKDLARAPNAPLPSLIAARVDATHAERPPLSTSLSTTTAATKTNGPATTNSSSVNSASGQTPSSTSAANCSTSTDAGHQTNAALSGLTGVKMSKKHHRHAAIHHHRRSGAAAATDMRRISASERCRTARVLAAEWLSSLMDNPPEASHIARYRAALQRQQHQPAQQQQQGPSSSSAASSTVVQNAAPSTTALLPSADSDAVAPSRSPQQHCSDPQRACSSGCSSTGGNSPGNTKSFADAVRNGFLKSPVVGPKRKADASQMAPQVTDVATAAATTGSTSPALNSHLENTKCHSAGSAAVVSPSLKKAVKLMPDDTTAIPQLLGVLREIALSCASLETLGGGKAPAATAAAPQPAMAKAVCAGPTSPGQHGSSSSNSTTSAAKELDVVYEAHWSRVRQHFDAVRRLVLNEDELSKVLDEALGEEWRHQDEEDKVESSCHSALPTEQSQSSAEQMMKSETDETKEGEQQSLPAAATNSIPVSTIAAAPAQPMPVDHKVPVMPRGYESTRPSSRSPELSRSSTVAHVPSVEDRTAAISGGNGMVFGSSSTPLNHNAAPFHCCSPSAAASQLSMTAGEPGPTASMKHLSGSSTQYSPSPQVATFLERATPPPPPPPPLPHVPDGPTREGVATVFPSTPLSEAAVPYQPTMMMSTSRTSPHVANASMTSSPSFHLESREDMIRRRSAAPNAFYASISHGGATHYLGGAASTTSTPGAFPHPGLTPTLMSYSPGGGGGGGPRSLPVSPLLTYATPLGNTTAQCPYDYLLVIDFEATCEEHPPANYLHEIIEFPVVLVDVRLQRVVAEFHRFVRPRYKVQLSHFCRQLTGMRQEDVDAAAPLEEVILLFERWYAHTVPPHARCVFATDGPMDMREFMYRHSVSRQGIRFPTLFYQYVDVKQIFSCFFQCAQGKIRAMLDVLNLPFEGRLHSGLDDARNIASIVIGLLQFGCTFCEAPLNRLPLNGLLQSSGGSGTGTTPLSLPPSAVSTGMAMRQQQRPPGSYSPSHAMAPCSVDED